MGLALCFSLPQEAALAGLTEVAVERGDRNRNIYNKTLQIFTILRFTVRIEYGGDAWVDCAVLQLTVGGSPGGLGGGGRKSDRNQSSHLKIQTNEIHIFTNTYSTFGLTRGALTSGM